MSDDFEIDLTPSRLPGPEIDLRDLGFVGHVSEEALAEIRAAEKRAAKVLSTSHLYRFD